MSEFIDIEAELDASVFSFALLIRDRIERDEWNRIDGERRKLSKYSWIGGVAVSVDITNVV